MILPKKVSEHRFGFWLQWFAAIESKLNLKIKEKINSSIEFDDNLIFCL